MPGQGPQGGSAAGAEAPKGKTKQHCAPSGHAMSPQQYAALGAQAAALEKFAGTYPFQAIGLLGYAENVRNVSEFFRGGPLDAQRLGAKPAYANYVYGVYFAAAGVPLSTALWGANTYGKLFSHYRLPPSAMSRPYPAIPAANVAAITAGYSALLANTLCTIY